MSASDGDEEDPFSKIESDENINQHPNPSFVLVEHAAASITLCLDAAPGCGGVAWPAGQVLSSYLAHRPTSTLHKKNIVELGSGTGYCGLVAAALGGLGTHVWITDQSPLLPIMRTNVGINNLTDSGRVRVVEYDWGGPKPSDLPNPQDIDIVLAADCVYFEPAFPLLVQTLCELAPFTGPTTDTIELSDAETTTKRNPEILFCYKKRRKADKRFFSLLKKHFEWSQVNDDPAFPVYSREAISLLRLWRR